ncbi:hypothetical protein BHM03_00019422 [Ensete ventricosum]|nr:hypothetical protein BHM03_00019422 [Ensete ventricosum]
MSKAADVFGLRRRMWRRPLTSLAFSEERNEKGRRVADEILLFTTLLVVTSWIGIVEGWRHRIGIEKSMEISSRGGSPDSPSSSNAFSFLLRCFSLSLAIARLESFVNNVWYIKILSPEDVLKMGKVGVESLC